MPDPFPSLRERKKAATKERLYFEALDLFRHKGFAATTVEEIAEAAEVSKGTFFNYFPSKEALLHYLSERLAASTAEALAALQADALTTRAKLNQILQVLVATVEADRELTRVAVFELLKAPAAIVADPYRNLLRQAVSGLLLEGQRRGEIAADLDPDLWSSAITGVYFQQLFEWCAAEAPYALGERMARLVEGLWRGAAHAGPGQ
jgi:TetR/AcrR family transcriptional regulator, cholesterol catabolism regulator